MAFLVPGVALGTGMSTGGSGNGLAASWLRVSRRGGRSRLGRSFLAIGFNGDLRIGLASIAFAILGARSETLLAAVDA